MNETKKQPDGSVIESSTLLEMQSLLEAEKQQSDMWRKECDLICDALADIAGLPREPRPGWMNCIEKIEGMLSNDEVSE